MIETLYGTYQLVQEAGPKTFFLALVIGFFFGLALERGGFGSSRRLAGIFYFRDMAVLKVMFSALVTAMLGLQLLSGLGWIDIASQVHLLPTIYGAQVVGGLLFGLGFVVSGWCPGTAAVGTASGRGDAVVFLAGTVLGAILFNELYPFVGWLARWGEQPEPLIAFGMSPRTFGFLLTLAAVGAFFFAEWVERAVAGTGRYLNSPFLKAFSVALVGIAGCLFLFPFEQGTRAMAGADRGAQVEATAVAVDADRQLLAEIEAEADHFEPEALADRLLEGDPTLVLVDIRSAAEYAAFHIRGAIHVPLGNLLEALEPYREADAIVLYSNGMTHPAQARDALARVGYRNVYLLTGGLEGFLQWCLKPVSLRTQPLPPGGAARIRAWRAYFLADEPAAPVETIATISDAPSGLPTASAPLAEPGRLRGMVSVEWLAANLNRTDLRIIDCRPQPEYNASHLPGSVCLNPENVRGVVGGVSPMLLPARILGEQFGLMGIHPSDHVVLVADANLRDATLIGMAFERVGHRRWGLLDGGFAKWSAENLPLVTELPSVSPANYPLSAGDAFTTDSAAVRSPLNDANSVILDTRPADYPPPPADTFSLDLEGVRARMGDPTTVLLDARPADFFRGEKSTEARAGHIPGAINRPYTEDLGDDEQLKPLDQLRAEYAALLGDREKTVLLHCRTGHQASQTYFVLKHLLGYPRVLWYDGGWTEWSARPELPVEQ